jgi:hypothetical protein
MPSLKRSTTRKVVRGGSDPSERLVREAIAFLFEIKGEEYRKLHPEFITPSVEEFLSYARAVSDALEKTRVTKKGGFRRKLPVLKHRGGSDLRPFLDFVIPGPGQVPNPCEDIVKMLTIMMYAIMVYAFVSVFMRETSNNPGASTDVIIANLTTAFNDPDFNNSLADPVRYICARFLPVLNPIRDEVVASVGRIVEQFISTQLTPLFLGLSTFQWVVAKAFGKGVSTALSTFFLTPLLLTAFVYIPIFCALGKIGYPGCDEICQKYKAQLRAMVRF